MHLSWCIYQTGIVKETKTLLKIMTECLLFHSFRTSRLLLWSLNWDSKLLFLIMIFCSTSMTCLKNSSKIITYWKQWKIARRTDWTNVLRKNKLTIGLVYTEEMTDTQMSWLHILVKDRGSTFIVILKTFMQGKLFCFSLLSGSC